MGFPSPSMTVTLPNESAAAGTAARLPRWRSRRPGSTTSSSSRKATNGVRTASTPALRAADRPTCSSVSRRAPDSSDSSRLASPSWTTSTSAGCSASALATASPKNGEPPRVAIRTLTSSAATADFLVDLQDTSLHRGGIEMLPDAPLPRLPESAPEGGIVEQRFKRRFQLARVPRRDEQARFTVEDRLPRAADARRDDRLTVCHRLPHDDPP